MTMHNALHPKKVMLPLYIPRKMVVDSIKPCSETILEAKKQKKQVLWEEKMLHGQFVQHTKK